MSPRSDVLGAKDRASGDNCKDEGERLSEALGRKVCCFKGSLWGWRCSLLSPFPMSPFPKDTDKS